MTTTTPTARELAQRTPETRNRYLDFLRVLALFVVVYGHFLMALVVVDGGAVTVENVLAGRPWVQWLTWILQVMPLFFIVGGFVNAASWESAVRRGDGYGTWVASRTRRLVGPAVVFVAVWSAVVLALAGDGVDPQYLALAGQVVAVPVWFLSVYLLVIAMAPVTHRLHADHGPAVIGWLLAAALAVELTAIAVPAVAWLNYVFVWGAIHQLGYLWRDGRFAARASGVLLAGGSLALLLVLVLQGPYAVAMVGIDGANNQPPNLALFLLGGFQLGVALILEPLMQRWLQRRRVWTAVVAANGLAMTVYLWHMTALVGFVSLGLIVENPLLGIEPMSGLWWATRPLWLAVLTIAVAPLVWAFRRFDTVAPPPRPVIWPAALVAAASASAGFGMLAARGFHPTDGYNLAGAVAFALAVAALHINRRRQPV